ncbi:class I SAM-dependent methyltransferase [uncultured Tolumonas sp.]|uniref:class I SAM-dependent DNA methyltransferase n=1 Tax=uncultured Tolumonas sp. TaxID=263765 RepID=UPI002A0A58F7|nr:class I SAM-dependent methyltransferase [uncultured Tolumonas sp.]
MSNGLNKTLYNMDDSHNEYGNHDVAQIAARWDAKARLWDEQFLKPDSHLNQDGAYDQFIADAQLILSQLGNRTINLLEIGCGTALVSDALQGNHIAITGIDISEKMLDKARKKKIKNASFFCADVFNLPIEGTPQYNVILSRGILLSHYCKSDVVALLNVIKRCGSLGDTVVMLDFLNADATDSSYHQPTNKTYYFPDEIRKVANEIGFLTCRFTGSPKHRTRCVILHL